MKALKRFIKQKEEVHTQNSVGCLRARCSMARGFLCDCEGDLRMHYRGCVFLVSDYPLGGLCDHVNLLNVFGVETCYPLSSAAFSRIKISRGNCSFTDENSK